MFLLIDLISGSDRRKKATGHACVNWQYVL